MELAFLSPEDELFLYETFMELSKREYIDGSEMACSEDESDVSIDVPLSMFFEQNNEQEECSSPVDPTLPITIPTQHVDTQTRLKSPPSSCESPTSLFPPIHLDSLLVGDTPSPTIEFTPPPTPTLQHPSFPQLKSDFSPPLPEPPPPHAVGTGGDEPPCIPTSQAESTNVQFIDLKSIYEKAQVRRKGRSEQRLVDCRIHMIATFQHEPRGMHIWVRRFAEVQEFQNTVELPVTVEKTLPNMKCFSVNLDDVYETSMGNRFYQLSTTDRQRKNRFVVQLHLMLADNSIAQFTSEPFLIRSRKISPNPRKPRTYMDT